MIDSIKSIFLWFVGVTFFVLSFFILLFLLTFFSRAITYKTGRFLFAILNKIVGINLQINGQENIDRTRSYLIMANHQSLFDVFVIPCAIPFPFVGIEASYHFDFLLWGRLMKKWGNIPIDRKNIKKAVKSIEKAESVLKEGLSIAILPEGHRTLTGKIGEFKKGGFHLAKNTKADILPLGISRGLFEFKNKNSWKLYPKKVTITIGTPINYSSYRKLSVDKLKEKVKETITTLSLD